MSPQGKNEHPPESDLRAQTPAEGTGPLFHRLYSIDFAATPAQAKAAWELLCRDINAFSPQLFASFKKTKGREDCLKAGDEFDVKLTAPWRAPVRVCDSSPGHFCLETLDGHLEAGRIQFSLLPLKDGRYRFEIESVARSKDEVVDFFYDKVPIVRYAQGEMWQKFCRNFAGCARTGKPSESAEEEVNVLTERMSESTGQWKTI
jgi:hypothetical protein